MNNINIAIDFTDAPGGRYIKEGSFSGELFLDVILRPKFINLKDGEILEINLDGG